MPIFGKFDDKSRRVIDAARNAAIGLKQRKVIALAPRAELHARARVVRIFARCDIPVGVEHGEAEIFDRPLGNRDKECALPTLKPERNRLAPSRSNFHARKRKRGLVPERFHRLPNGLISKLGWRRSATATRGNE